MKECRRSKFLKKRLANGQVVSEGGRYMKGEGKSKRRRTPEGEKSVVFSESRPSHQEGGGRNPMRQEGRESSRSSEKQVGGKNPRRELREETARKIEGGKNTPLSMIGQKVFTNPRPKGGKRGSGGRVNNNSSPFEEKKGDGGTSNRRKYPDRKGKIPIRTCA